MEREERQIALARSVKIQAAASLAAIPLGLAIWYGPAAVDLLAFWLMIVVVIASFRLGSKNREERREIKRLRLLMAGLIESPDAEEP